MEITKYTWHDKNILFSQIRKITLLGHKDIAVYEGTDIALETIPISWIQPCQFYQLEQGITDLALIQNSLLKVGISIFQLDGYIQFWTQEDQNGHTLLPPIIEVEKDAKGKDIYLLVDGIHRVSIARQQKEIKMQVITIRNISHQYPFVANPNYRGWKDVLLQEMPPSSGAKRSWRMPPDTAYAYYRNFDEVFPNSSKPRTQATEKKSVAIHLPNILH